MTLTTLKKHWRAYKEENPGVRIRDAAKALHVSEAELLATQLGESVVRLKSEWDSMLLELEGLGEVMALTRNELFVHEKVGRYSHASVMPDHNMGQILDKDIDLRIFFKHWAYSFAVTVEKDAVLKRSLQYFDHYGNAVHKTHLRPASDLTFYNAFVDKYRHENQHSFQGVASPKKQVETMLDEEVDSEALRTAWSGLRNTHDFIFMLRAFNVDREQALRIAGGDFAWQVDTTSLITALEASAEIGLPLMIFVNNPGCVQIHSGPVYRLKAARGWYNVLDPGFNLHVRNGEIASAWVVKKPVDTGHVHSVEFYDKDGQALCYMFGKRKEGEPELASWRQIIHTLEPLSNG